MRITRRAVLAVLGAAFVVPKALGRVLGGKPKQAKDITVAEIQHWAERLPREYKGTVTIEYWANGKEHVDVFDVPDGWHGPPIELKPEKLIVRRHVPDELLGDES